MTDTKPAASHNMQRRGAVRRLADCSRDQALTAKEASMTDTDSCEEPLKGHVALITGAARGIGAACAAALARAGAAVVINYRTSKAEAEAAAHNLTAQGRNAAALQADMADLMQAQSIVGRAAELFGPVDILVNNASEFLPAKPFLEAAWDDFETEISACLRCAFNATQASLPGMKDKGWGRIINIVGSLVERPAARYSAHIAAKAALPAMTRTLALEFAPLGITVNAVSPGVVATEATRALRQKVLDSLIRKTPLGRLASAEEVAAAVVFLASPEANYITGAHLPVDGGLSVA